MELRSLLNVFKRDESRNMSWDSYDLIDYFGASKKAGQTVNEETALSVMAVFAAVRIISEGMASLPVAAYVESPEGFSTEAKRQPEWLTTPHRGLQTTMQDLVATALVSLLLRGNAYIFVTRGAFNGIEALEVVDPNTVTLKRQGGFIVYTIDGVDYTAENVLHIRGMALPGSLEGMDPISYAAATLGTGMASQEYGATYFENASLPSGFIGVPGNLSDVGAEMLRNSWNRLHSGQENAGSVAVLTEGAEFKTLALSPEQTQFLEVRRFTVQDVARLFGVPPHLLADSSNSTSWGSGLAEQNTAFSKMTLTPWAMRIETALTVLLRSTGGPRQHAKTSVQINLDGFERGSYSDRINTYAAGITAGIYDPNEVRGWEDLPPLDHHHTGGALVPSDPEPGAATPAVQGADPTTDEPEEG